MAQVTVNRASEFAYSARSYKLLLDGQEVAKVTNGKSASFSVSPGSHKLEVKCDFYSGEPVDFQILDNESLVFGVQSVAGPSMFGFFFRPKFWAAVFKPKTYFILSKQDPPPVAEAGQYFRPS